MEEEDRRRSLRELQRVLEAHGLHVIAEEDLSPGFWAALRELEEHDDRIGRCD